MGGSLSGGYASSKSSTELTETKLATTQREWLEYQINNYKNIFFPYLKEGLENSTDINSQYSMAQLQQNAKAAQESYAAANRATSQSLKQQGLAGNKSGVENLIKGYNERAKASTLASSYYNQLINNEQDKMKYLQLGIGMTPGTTTATPMNSSTSTSGFSVSGSVSAEYPGMGGGANKASTPATT